jgi:hypothetical protein
VQSRDEQLMTWTICVLACVGRSSQFSATNENRPRGGRVKLLLRRDEFSMRDYIPVHGPLAVSQFMKLLVCRQRRRSSFRPDFLLASLAPVGSA